MTIRNFNPATEALLDGLLSPKTESPPGQYSREGYFRHGKTANYYLTSDWPVKQDRWDSPEAISYGRREVNSVEYLIDGYPTYAAMLEAIETATKPEHFIVLLGWALNLNFVMVKNESARTTLDGLTGIEVLRKKTEEGVKVRVLLWNNALVPTEYSEWGQRNNLMTKEQIDKLNPTPLETPRRAICLLDDNTRFAGAHHQKVLLVSGSEGLIGFIGGLDINSDRVLAEKARFFVGKAFIEVGAPLHDVHVRVRGSAATDLMTLAINRWRFAKPVKCYLSMSTPPVAAGLPAPNLLTGVDPAIPDGKTDADIRWGYEVEELKTLSEKVTPVRIPEPIHTVRIGQTVGNPDLAQASATTGKSDAWKMIRHGIRSAKKFIYIEDQYFWSKAAAEELAAALPNIEHLIIMVCSDEADPSAAMVRHMAIDRLFEKIQKEDDKKKVGIYNRREAFERYIHAKMLIIDDELAIIGSANMNNRGYTHDSEVIGAITDPSWDDARGPREGKWYALELNLAHKLRMQLWAEHLKVPWTRLFDPLAAAVYWQNPPPSANIMVSPYKPGTAGGMEKVKDYLLDPLIFDPEEI